MEIAFIKNKLITLYFSRDRPLQLELTLKSNYLNCPDLEKHGQVVLYKATTEDFEIAYQILQGEYPNVVFIQEKSFKKDLLEIIDANEYVLFVVDDCVFIRAYSLDSMLKVTEESTKVIGFSLRLGKNIHYCYPLNLYTSPPPMEEFSASGAYFYDWTTESGDFSYPLEVSSSLYKVEVIKNILKECEYNNPNYLEWFMSRNSGIFAETLPYLMCYQTSVAFCNPLNRVQTTNTNRAGTNPEYSIENLLDKFMDDYRISYDKFDKFTPIGCHQEVDIEFVEKTV